jgi:hypothetical protein
MRRTWMKEMDSGDLRLTTAAGPAPTGSGALYSNARGEAALTTYEGAEHQLAEAQAVLNLHSTSSATGLCQVCGVPGPCFRRESAISIFSRYLRLPRRVPGLSKPDLIGARRVA